MPKSLKLSCWRELARDFSALPLAYHYPNLRRSGRILARSRAYICKLLILKRLQRHGIEALSVAPDAL